MPLLNDRRAAIAEVVGLAFILVSVGWQFFVERPAVELNQGVGEFETYQRLQLIWDYLEATADTVASRPETYESLDGRWPLWNGSAGSVAESQAAVSQHVTFALFLLGSILTIVGRGYEIKDRFKHPAA